MKFIKKQIVYHIGELDKSKKRKGSYETNLGISVSEVPRAWARIARPLSGKYYIFENKNGIFLDKHKLTNSDKKKIWNWGEDAGLIEERVLYHYWYFDDEMEEFMGSVFDSKEELENEAGESWEELQKLASEEDPYLGEPSIKISEKSGYVATKKFNDIIGWEISHADVDDFLIILYAKENLDVDGVWFDDRLDVIRLSAPRGMIFDDKLSSWDIREAQEEEVPNEIDEDDEDY